MLLFLHLNRFATLHLTSLSQSNSIHFLNQNVLATNPNPCAKNSTINQAPSHLVKQLSVMALNTTSRKEGRWLLRLTPIWKKDSWKLLEKKEKAGLSEKVVKKSRMLDLFLLIWKPTQGNFHSISTFLILVLDLTKIKLNWATCPILCVVRLKIKVVHLL